MIKGYKDLVVWQKSMDMVEQVYMIVKKLPKEENYALGDQLRRAAVSVPSNIAEGNARHSAKEYIHFLAIANGSCAEVETQLELVARLHYVDRKSMKNCFDLLVEIGKMLVAMQEKLRKSDT